jgi:hypothetical protein
MAEPPKSKVELPWGTLLPLIAALAGILAQYRPLVSSRPPAPGEKSIEAVAEQDVDARLWQDPLLAAEKQFEEHEREESNLQKLPAPEVSHAHTPSSDALKKSIKRRTSGLEHTPHKQSKVQEPISPETSDQQKHSLDALKKLIKGEVSKLQANHHILLLSVMIDAGPYIEQGESRLRSRRAVLEGLSQSGFAPKDSEHIGFISTDWPLGHREGKLLIPWEECQAVDQPEKLSPPGIEAAFVLWLPASSFNPFPLTRFAALLNNLTDLPDRNGAAAKLKIVLIGPTNSDGLRNIVQEAVALYGNSNTDSRNLNGLSIISARASIPDEELLADPSQSSVDAVIAGAWPGVHFKRSVTPDDKVLRRLINELRLRDIQAGDKIVILTEWDSTYGRSLGKIFASLVPKTDIYSYQYLRGIDGRLPSDRIQTPNEQEQKQKSRNEQPEPKIEEATEGTNQSDFLRRLARKLKDEDRDARRNEKGRIRAIGLLGADIYDKLMILRALRPEFPEAIFFTNGYDAHFERREDWRDVRSLVIASPFGGKLPKELEVTETHVTPFRDSGQTSMYVATLLATQRLGETAVQKLTTNVRIFEIGRQGAYDLDNAEDRHWFRDWLKAYLNQLYLIGTAVTVIVLTIWIRYGIVPAQFPTRRTALNRWAPALCDTASWVVCGSVVIVLLVCFYAQGTNAGMEPLQFRSGISIWPTEILRLIALLLSIHFIVKAFVTLKLNERDISDRFCLNDPPSDNFWQNCCRGFTSWRKADKNWTKSKHGFSVQDAWHTLLYHSAFLPTVLRVSILVALYLMFRWLLQHLVLTGRLPFVPARGEMAFRASEHIYDAATISFTVLAFYVVDATQLHANFIRVFTKGLTNWQHAACLQGRGVLSDREVSRYNDVLFVAERTKVVAQLIWYPLIVLAILVVARSSFFANWTWPTISVVTYGLSALLAIGSAIFLRHVAEKLRKVAIEDLRLLRSADYQDALKRDAFSEVIDEIRKLKTGAFAPITDQPFIRAILLPGAALGLLSVAQWFFGFD